MPWAAEESAGGAPLAAAERDLHRCAARGDRERLDHVTPSGGACQRPARGEGGVREAGRLRRRVDELRAALVAVLVQRTVTLFTMGSSAEKVSKQRP